MLKLFEDEEEEEDIDNKLGKIEEVVHKAAKEHVEFTTPLRRDHWYNQECMKTSKV